MKTKSIPAIIMLTAGCIACIVGITGYMETEQFMKMLFVVLIVFYFFGCIVKIILDKNFQEMKEETTEGEESTEEGSTEEDSGEKSDEEQQNE